MPGLYYAWTPPGGLDDPSAAQPLASPSATGLPSAIMSTMLWNHGVRPRYSHMLQGYGVLRYVVVHSVIIRRDVVEVLGVFETVGFAACLVTA